MQDVENDLDVDLKELWSKSIDTPESTQQEEDVHPRPDTSDSPGTFAGIMNDLLSCKPLPLPEAMCSSSVTATCDAEHYFTVHHNNNGSCVRTRQIHLFVDEAAAVNT